MAMSKFGESHVIINMDDSFISAINKGNTATPLICKIESTTISDEDKKDYEPKVLSIGPYHNRKLSTRDVQLKKYECLDNVLKMNRDKKLEDYIKAIKEMESQIRSCYRDDIEMDTNSFLNMLLLDGCFIIIFLGQGNENQLQMSDMSNEGTKLKIYENMGETIIDIKAWEAYECQKNIQTNQGDAVNEENSRHFRMLDYGLSDILLIENQIPFFVIAKIYEIANGGIDKTSFLVENIARYIEGMIECYPKSFTELGQPREFHHLLHLCHKYLTPKTITYQSFKSLNHESFHWHRATEYDKIGISFIRKEFVSDNPHSLLDIGFYDGIMEIPCLMIDDSTRCLFRNLIAFEKRCPQIRNHVTAYAVFLSQFISMPDDVALLRKKGIIVNLLNSDAEVCDIFTKLAEDVVFDFHGACYLNSTYSEMETHYRNNKPRLMTRFGSIISNLHHSIPQNPFNHI